MAKEPPKNVLMHKHCKTIYEPVVIGYSPVSVFLLKPWHYIGQWSYLANDKEAKMAKDQFSFNFHPVKINNTEGRKCKRITTMKRKQNIDSVTSVERFELTRFLFHSWIKWSMLQAIWFMWMLKYNHWRGHGEQMLPGYLPVAYWNWALYLQAIPFLGFIFLF